MKRVKYSLYRTKEYAKDLRKILKKNKDLTLRIERAVIRILRDPFSPSLRTHQVNIPSLGKVYSSRISGDVRILWTFEEEGVILLQRVGGHSKVYR